MLPIRKRFPRFHRVSMTIGKPYTPDQLKQKVKNLHIKDDYEAIARAIQEEVKRLAMV